MRKCGVKKILFFFRFVRPLGIGALVFFAFSGCVTQRRVAVGLSAEMENYYAIYPSIEFDAAAVTEEEEKQIKSEGVDKYFAPGSPLRKRLDPFTVYFSQEQTLPAVLPYQSTHWEKWLAKKPVTLVLIANLPHSPDMPEDDPRVLYIDIKKRGLFAEPVYVEIEPQKIVRIFDLPRDPRTGLPVENPKPGNTNAENRVHEDTSP
jgi:hypothetical protein